MNAARTIGIALAAVVAATLPVCSQTAPGQLAIVGDEIPQALTGQPGDAERGRAIVANRQVGLCLLCHSGPFPQERFQGDLAPDLAGAGSRSTPGQLRLRIVDASQLNADTIMPPYYRIKGLTRVGAAFRGATILSAQQIEDVIAFLTMLKG
jgi:sulfur-oxidizing protein SoxX